MTTNDMLLAADEGFFDALVAGNISALEALLSDDFRIVDVVSGNVSPKSALIDGIRDGFVTFAAVDRNPIEANVRIFGEAGIIINQTTLRGSLGGNAFETRSRYTHVFVLEKNVWRMVSAQGTSMATP